MPNEILLPGSGGGERRRVTPISQMSFDELNQKRIAGDFEGDDELKRRAGERHNELVQQARQVGIFDQIDRSALDILAQSRSYGEAALNLSRSRQDILRDISEQTDYRNKPHLAGIAETEIDSVAEFFRISQYAQTLDTLGGSAKDREDFEKRFKDYKRGKIRTVPYLPSDFGKDIPAYEKDRPDFKYSDIKGILENEDTDSDEFKDSYQKRRDLIRYYQRHDAINVKDVKDRVDEILTTSDSSNVHERLRNLQREVEEDAQKHPGYKDRRLAGDIVGGVVEVGSLAAGLDPADPDRANQINEARSRALALNIPTNQIEQAFRKQPATVGGSPDLAVLAAAQLQTADAMRRSAEVQEKSYELAARSYNDYIRQEAQRAQLDPYEFERQQPGWYRELDSNEIKNEKMQRVITFRNRLSFNARVKQEQGPLNLEVSTHPQTMEWPVEVWDDMWMEMPGHRVAFVSIFRENFRIRNDGFIELSDSGIVNLSDFNRYKREKVSSLADIIKNSHREMAAGGWSDKLRIDPIKDNGQIKTPEEISEGKAKLLATAAFATVANMLFVGGAAESGMYDRKINDQTVVSEQFRSFMHPLRKAVDKTFKEPFEAEEWGGPLGNWYLQMVTYADGFKDQYDLDDLENSTGPMYFPSRLYCSIFEIADFKRGGHAEETFARAILSTPEDELVSLGNDWFDLPNPESLRPIDLGEGSQYNLWGAKYADVMDSVTKVFSVISGKAAEAKVTRSALANALAKARKQSVQFEKILSEEDFLMACVAGLTVLYGDPRDPESGGPMQGSARKGGKEFLINAPLDIYDIVVDKATKEPRFFENKEKRDIRKKILERLKAYDETVFSLSTTLKGWVGGKGLPKVTERSDMYAEAISNQNKMRRQEHFKLK